MRKSSRRAGPPLLTKLRLQAYEVVAPGKIEQKLARAFVTPRQGLVPDRAPLDLPTPTETTMVPSGDDWVAAWRWGEGPAVLLVHGWEDDHHCFEHLISQLRTLNIPVVAFDLPAHGKSGGHRTALPFIRRAIFDVASHLGPIRAVVGHSLGGAGVALAVAAGLPVERAVTVAAPVSVSDALRMTLQQLGLSQERRYGIERELFKLVGVSVYSLAISSVAGKLTIPALVMHAFNDRVVPFEAGARLAKAWRGSRFVAMEEVGHRRMLAERSTLDQIVGFLQERAKLASVAA
jgi:pimeloyl-ACP methyl ester carboxylesterase